MVEEEGAGTPLLLIHGLGMSSALWRNQVPVFAQHSRTVAVDLRGFGRSSKPGHPGAYAIDVLAEDMVAVMQRLGLAGCHVLGTSMGGFVAQAIAIAHPELCRSLILCHTAPRMAIPADVIEKRVTALDTMAMDEYAAIVLGQALAPGASAGLRAWVAESKRTRRTAPAAIGLERAIHRTPQRREAAPELAEVEAEETHDTDVLLQRLIDAASPAERARLHAMPEEQRMSLLRLMRDQDEDRDERCLRKRAAIQPALLTQVQPLIFLE